MLHVSHRSPTTTMSNNELSGSDDTIPLLGSGCVDPNIGVAPDPDPLTSTTLTEEQAEQLFMDTPIPKKHIISIVNAYGSTDVDLADEVLKLRAEVDTLRAAYFREGRSVLTKGGKEKKSRAAQFQAITAAFEILSNPFWRKRYEEYRCVERNGDSHSNNTSIDSIGDIAMRRTKTWSPGKTKEAATGEFYSSPSGEFCAESDFGSSPAAGYCSLPGDGFAKSEFRGKVASPVSVDAFIDNEIVDDEGFCGQETRGNEDSAQGAPADVILHDLVRPVSIHTTSKTKKVVQFDLETILKDKQREEPKVEDNVGDMPKSIVSGGESLLDTASADPAAVGTVAENGPAATDGATGGGFCQSSEVPTFTSPQEFMEYVRQVVSDVLQKVSEVVPTEAAKSSAALEASCKDFANYMTEAGNKASVDIVLLHKSVVESLSLPDDKMAEALNVLSLESCQVSEMMEKAASEMKEASSKIPQSCTM